MIRVTLGSSVPLYLNPQRILFVRENKGGRPFQNPAPPAWYLVPEEEMNILCHRSVITYQNLHPSCPDNFTCCESPDAIAALMKEAQRIVQVQP